MEAVIPAEGELSLWKADGGRLQAPGAGKSLQKLPRLSSSLEAWEPVPTGSPHPTPCCRKVTSPGSAFPVPEVGGGGCPLWHGSSVLCHKVVPCLA